MRRKLVVGLMTALTVTGLGAGATVATAAPAGAIPQIKCSQYRTQNEISRRAYDTDSTARAQCLLNLAAPKLGLPATSTDGVFGKETERNVREFQRKMHLRADGVVGAKTWAALNSFVPVPEMVAGS